MKSTLFTGLVFVLLLALAGFQYYQYQQQQAVQANLQNELVTLHSRLERLEMNMAKARSDMEQLEENSLGGLIEDANDALIEGWSAMMNAVGKELETARRSFEEKRREMEQEDSTSPTGSAQPSGEEAL